MMKVLQASLFLLFFTTLLTSQEVRPVVALFPIQSDITTDETAIIEDLVWAYLENQTQFSLLPKETLKEALQQASIPGIVLDQLPRITGELTHTKYMITGLLNSKEYEIKLELSLLSIPDGLISTVTASHTSLGELALETSNLTKNLLFTLETTPTDTSLLYEQSSAPNTRTLEGSWRGEKGLELIRIANNGTAQAFFSSGALMEMEYEIKDTTVRFIQKSPHNVRYFHPLPWAIASQLVSIAEKQEWLFTLSNDEQTLTGIKKHTAVRYEKEIIVEIYENSQSPSIWTRIKR